MIGFSFRIRIPDPNPEFVPIPDPGVRKSPDPESVSATLQLTINHFKKFVESAHIPQSVIRIRIQTFFMISKGGEADPDSGSPTPIFV